MAVLRIGDPVPDVKLKGLDGKIHTLADLRGTRCTTLVFNSLDNPYFDEIEDRVMALQSSHVQPDVRFVLVVIDSEKSEPEELLDLLLAKARDKGYNFPCVQDYLKTAAADYGVTRIPVAYLIDSELKLRYQGAIDDNPSKPDKVTRHYLRDAMEGILKGSEIAVTETEPIGQKIKWSE